jgi:hypothetical protein
LPKTSGPPASWTYWASSAADQVLPAIGRALGVTEVPGEALEHTLARVLESRALLLVLDNFEHVLAAAPGSPSCCCAVRA